ncbi:Neuroligin-4: X-linked-like protein, partial [Dinothrombium tinctorium]
MDQVAALHWIQENIVEFGGDASNVTIMGQGYGAACVNLLMLSPMAKGLFHRAIMQSGSALSPWAMASDSIKYSKQLAKSIGCPDVWERNSPIVDCLRSKTVKELQAVDFRVATHLTGFGPTVDGVVVPNDPTLLMADSGSLYGNYDLLLGVTKVESYRQFTSYDERHGIDPSRRDRILRTLVRNLFTFHLQEIYLTIGNEYTDWSRSALHPSTIFDSLVDAIGDATIVGPLIRAALFHSRRKRNTFLYAFLYATEEGDYPSKLGCIHGEDLLYVLGAPLVNGMQLGFFSKTFTRQESSLSEAVMNYWSNFVKHGDPNPVAGSEQSEKGDKGDKSDKSGGKSRDRFEKIVWPQYEEQQQQYLSITMKPKVRDHYHAHRLSYWVNLIPRLHVPGPSSPEHHLLHDHDAINSYDGVVRDKGVMTSSMYLNKYLTTQSSSYQINAPQSSDGELNGAFNATKTVSTTSVPTGASSSGQDHSHQQSALDASANNNNINSSAIAVTPQTNYSTALSVTIAIGCSLLLLNVLVFAGIFYQRDKERAKNKAASAALSRNAYQESNVKNNVDELSLMKNSSLSSPRLFLENNSYAETKGGELPNDLTTITGQTSPIVVQQWVNQQSISPSLGYASTQKVTTTGTVHFGLPHSRNYQHHGVNTLQLPQINESKINAVNMIDSSELTEQHFKSISSDI